ncbi:MAG TPA: tetratricopeptide repeat protein [Beijerinckiaceae bacterium]
MVQLRNIVSPTGSVRANAVFVHGLGGRIDETWGGAAEGDWFWPRALGEEIEGVGVYLVGYEAAVSRWRGRAMHLPDLATGVLARLLTQPKLREAPLVLIGHSLGGLVIKQLLRIAESEARHRADAAELLARVEKIAFLATPHTGAGQATLGDRLRLLVRPSASTASLVRNDPSLRELNLWYRDWAAAREIAHLVLTETEPIRILGTIVLPDSSDPGLPRVRPIPISADHWGICKPADRECDAYLHVRDFIGRKVERPRDTQAEKIDALKEDTAAIRAQLDAVVKTVMTQDRERLDDAGIGRELVLELARRLKPEEALSFEQAVTEVRAAVETAIRVVEEGRRGSNLGEFVDSVLKRIAERTLAQDFEGAASEADRAFAEWRRIEEERRAESTAAGVRILEAGIEQDRLRRDFKSAAARIAAAVDLEHQDPEPRFAALRQRWDAFYVEGRDKGINASLELAIEIARIEAERANSAEQQGVARNDLGAALQVLGERESGTARLEEAVAAYRAALKEHTRERVPLDWAMTQNNLGTALATLGERESGTGRLEEAVAACRAALEEYTRERVPLDWAATQNNLGSVLQALGERESGTARLEEAVAAYRAALDERTRERVPLAWAMTQNNLGTALQFLGGREGGTARLEEAVAAYRAALEEYTRERVPLHWAGTQNNFSNALALLGERESGTARLEEAVAAYRAVLEEYARERVPLDWAMTQNNLGNALLALGERESGTARLEEAVAAYRAALEERTRERAPLDWAMTQNNLGNALRALGERESGTARLEEAVAAYRAALDERTRERVPLAWAMTQNNLGTALQFLGGRESGTARLEEAVAAYRAALEEHTPERVPLAWAASTGNQGLILRALAERGADPALAERALAQIEAAFALCREAGHAPWAAFYEAALPKARALVERLR